MKKTKLPAILLAAVMLAVCYAGCGKTEKAETTASTTAATETTAEAATETTTEAATETATEATTTAAKTYGGYEFSITYNSYFPKYNDDGSFKDSLSEELFQKLDALEKKLDCKFIYVEPGDNESLELVTTAAMGGIKFADLIRTRQDKYWPLARLNAIIPVDGEQLTSLGLDYADETRWFQPASEQSKLFGSVWGVNVASKYFFETAGYFVCFNHDLVDSAGLNVDLYQKVRDHEWNWELYREIARLTTKDLNGDDVIDQWGTGATAFGNEIVSKEQQYIGQDSSGKWVLTISSDAGKKALQTLLDVNIGDGTHMSGSTKECRAAFCDGKVTFCFAYNNHIAGPGTALYDASHDYGIIPMPLLDGASEYSAGSNNNRCIVFQAANEDLARTVAIANEWALVLNDTESWKETFDDGRCRTEADKEMMFDYILPNFILDYSCMSDEIYDAINDGLYADITKNGMTVAQAIETYEPVVNSLLDGFFNQ